jgi:K+-transporting ATPase A subunit/DNA-binding CsgD family transcriptional regulator
MLPWLLAAITLAAVALTAPSLGRHLFEVFDGRPQPAWDRWLKPIEAGLLRWVGDSGRSADSAMGYLLPLLISNALFGAVALLLLLLQPAWLNPLGFGGLRWDLALHTTISFLTNTDQQHLVPEQSLGNLAQLGAMQFLMFVSAATGLAVGFAVIRGFSGRPIGNFHLDLLRALTRVLIPASLLLALQAGNPMLERWLSGGNLQGKELRFGAGLTGLWSVVTTGTMTGAVNGAIDAAMPLTILTALFNLFLQVVVGGQGTGIAYLLVYVLLAVFLTGLMVGRTPEFLGRKVEKAQVVWASWWDQKATAVLQRSDSQQAVAALNQDERLNDLTQREREVLACLAAGDNNRCIAEQLGIGEGTVRSHVHALLQKLQVSNRTQAALIWLTAGEHC